MKLDLTQTALIELAVLYRIDIVSKEEGAEKHLLDIKRLLLKLQSNQIKFSSFDKAFFIGCLRERYLNNRKYLFELENIEIYKNLDKYYDEYIFINEIYIIIEKLNIKHKNSSKYKELVSNMKILKKCKDVYYSKSNDRIYKIAIMQSKSKGFSYGLDQTMWDFKLKEIDRDSYMYEGKLEDVLMYIKKYSDNGCSSQRIFLELFSI